MSNLSDHVSLQIQADSSGVARASFGVPLILSHSAAWVERVRYYTDLPSVGLDFATTSPEYLSANAIFAQNPHPDRIAIGRAANKPTQVYILGVNSVLNLQPYAVNVAGQGVTATATTFTTDGTATNDEIVAGIVAALNAVVGKNYTAAATGSAGSQVVTVTGNAAGNWFSLQVTDPSLLSSKQTHGDPGLAADLNAILLEQNDFYAVTTNFNSQIYVTAVATWVEANNRLYVVDVSETRAITAAYTPAGTGDTLEALKTAAFTRTAAAYHQTPAAMMSAAWLGRMLPIDPGGDDWKFKSLATVPATNLNGTYRANLRARSADALETVAGKNITWEGTTSDGGFIDTRRGLDWIQDDMVKGVFGRLIAQGKTPYTDAGIAIVQSEVYASLKRAVAMGILADSPKPVVQVPLAANVSSSNKALRLLTGVKFFATLAGSVHKVQMTGTVTF